MSRDRILQAVRAAQPEALPLPDLTPLQTLPKTPALADFTATLDFIGARWRRAADLAEVATALAAERPAGAAWASTVPGLAGSVDLAAVADPHDLGDLHAAVLPGRFGVCENGAVWLDETALGPHRVLPFIAQHLVLVLPARELVADLHQAYARLGAPDTGFGLFLAGPSKTADIEQCLVVGAHGARSCTVWLLGEPA